MLGKRKLQFVSKEGAADPAKSTTVMKQLAAVSSVLATICCILSPVAGALKPIAAQSKMLTVIYRGHGHRATQPALHVPDQPAAPAR